MNFAATVAVAVLVATSVATGDSDARAPAIGVETALAARVAETRSLAAPLPLPSDRAPRLVLAGDSVADTLADAFAAEAGARGFAVTRSVHPGCGLLRGLPTTLDGYTPPWAAACDRAAPDWWAQISRLGADLIVVLSTWDGSSRLLDGAFVDPATPEGHGVMAGLLREAIDAIAPSGSGRGVVLLAEAIPTRGSTTGDPSPGRVTEARHHRSVLRTVARDDPARVRMVDLGTWLCPTGSPCPEVVDGLLVRPNDGGHLSADGAAWLAPRLLDALTTAP